MTRKEEITMAADAASRYESPSFFEAFVTGAEWADAHPDIDVRTMAAWQSGYNEGIAKPSWISVEEIQPKKDEWFLGYSPLKSPLSSMEIDVYNFNSNGLIEAHGITHWMPLPAPPKKGGELIPRNELCKHYRSWVGTSKGEINCACVDYERKIITKCDFIQNKGCWKTQRKEAKNEPDKTTLHQAQPHQPTGSDLRRELQEISVLSGDREYRNQFGANVPQLH